MMNTNPVRTGKRHSVASPGQQANPAIPIQGKRLVLKKHVRTWEIGILLAFFLTACGSPTKKPELLGDTEKSYLALSLDQLSAKGDTIRDRARELQLATFAPRKNREIEKILEHLKAAVKLNDRKTVVDDVIEGNRLLSEGEQSKLFVQTEMHEELALDASLQKLGTASVFPKEYQRLATDLGEMIAKIEEGKAAKVVKDRQKLLAALKRLEIKIVRFYALSEAEKSIAEARKQGVDKYAPVTFMEALSAFKSTEEYIAKNPHDDTGIAKMTKETTFAIQHAFNAAKTVQTRGEKKIAAEQLLRDEELNLRSIGQVLGIDDMRDRLLPGQVEGLAAASRQCVANAAAMTESSSALDRANREIAEAKAQILKLQEGALSSKQEADALRTEAATTSGLKARVDELEKASAGLNKENERLRVEAATAAKLKARVEEYAAYCGPPPATE